MAELKQDKGPYSNFPSHNETNKNKESLEYGKKVVKAINAEWTRRENNVGRFYANQRRYHTQRLYAVGDQDIRRYKDEFSTDGDLSYLNLDFTPVPIIPKFVDIVVNGMADRDFTIQANAIDPTSSKERKEHFDRMKVEIDKNAELLNIQELSGVEIFQNDPSTLPKNQEELDLYTQLDYKQSVELAIEKGVEYVFNNNRHDEVKYRYDYDLVTIGIGAAKHEFCPSEGVKIKYVDPANMVYSYSESKFLEDIYYAGEVRRTHVTELQKMFPNMTDEQYDNILKHGRSWYDQYNITYNLYDDDPGTVDVLYFSYRTTEKEVFKVRETSTGGKRAIKKDDTFDPPKDKRAGHEKIERVNDVIYEGVAIFGSDMILKWEKAKNMVRPGYNSPKVQLPYIITKTKQYKGKVYSLVQRMIKYADRIQLDHLKMQQVIQKMTPSGVFLDADGLADVDLGNGTNYNAQEALRMYFQTGSIVGRSYTDAGTTNAGKIPIQELPGGQGLQLQQLINDYEYQLQQIRNVTGLNEARDGTSPDAKALVGVQKLAAANSNTATRHILDSSVYLTTSLAKGAALRLADAMEHSKNKKNLVNAIGQYSVDALDDVDKIHHHQYGIFIELGPDEVEKDMLENNIQISLSKDLLKPEDAIEIRRIKNYKLANQMLKLRRQQRDEAENNRQQELIRSQAETNAQSAQASEQAKAQAHQIMMESDTQLEQTKSELLLQRLDAEKEHKKELMLLEFELNLDLKGIDREQNRIDGAQKHQTEMSKEKLKQSAGSGVPSKPFESSGNDSGIGRGIPSNNFEPS